jgi:hypothetical protein
MKTMVISYSFTGNNADLAATLAATLGAEHVKITEPKPRTMGKIAWDIVLKRTPKIIMPVEETEEVDLVLFVGPVWMGHVATPFRACFEQLGQRIDRYAFLSISGGADGPNPNLADELEKRLGKEPACLMDLHIADLLPPEPRPTREVTMAYRINEREVKHLADTIVEHLNNTILVQ